MYLAPSVHNQSGRASSGKIDIFHEEEFIGFSRANEVIVEIGHGDNQCFRVYDQVGLNNITFRMNDEGTGDRSGDRPGTSQGSGDNAIITTEESAGQGFVGSQIIC